MVTPAIKLLEASAIEHRLLSYGHSPQAESYGAGADRLDPTGAELVSLTVVERITGQGGAR